MLNNEDLNKRGDVEMSEEPIVVNGITFLAMIDGPLPAQRWTVETWATIRSTTAFVTSEGSNVSTNPDGYSKKYSAAGKTRKIAIETLSTQLKEGIESGLITGPSDLK